MSTVAINIKLNGYYDSENNTYNCEVENEYLGKRETITAKTKDELKTKATMRLQEWLAIEQNLKNSNTGWFQKLNRNQKISLFFYPAIILAFIIFVAALSNGAFDSCATQQRTPVATPTHRVEPTNRIEPPEPTTPYDEYVPVVVEIEPLAPPPPPAPAPEPEPTPEPVPEQPIERMVYVTPQGQRYHRTRSCRGLNRARSISSVTLSQARRNRTPCNICRP